MAPTNPFDETPAIKHKLPACIYTSAMLCGLGAQPEELEFPISLHIYLILLPQFCLVVLNIVIQSSFIYYIMHENRAGNSCDVIKSSHMLRYLALGLFGGEMLQEFVEIVNMLLWTWHVKTEPTHQALLVDIPADGTCGKLCSGLTCWQKVLFIILMIVPKLAIAIGLFIHGSQFVVLSATDTELVLNCVAMMFVVEVDDLFYKAFTPEFCRDVIDNMPPVEVIDETMGTASLLIFPWLKAGIWGCSVYIMMALYDCESRWWSAPAPQCNVS